MPQQEARAWWADVEHLREELEERRETARADAPALHLVNGGGEAAGPVAPQPARRTVRISGRGGHAPAPRRLVEVERRRPAPSLVERAGARPDRIAGWAALLGVVLVLVAALTAGS